VTSPAAPAELPSVSGAVAQPGAEGQPSKPLGAGPVKQALVLFAAVLALCLVAYLAMALPAAWFPKATPKAWFAQDLSITRGAGHLVGGDLLVTGTDATGVAIVSANTEFNSVDYPVVAWAALDVPENADVRLLWRNDYMSGVVNTVALKEASGRLLPLSLAKNPNWIGHIKGLALLIRAPIQEPIKIHGVRIKPMGAIETMQDRLREWLTFEAWTGTSINNVAGGADLQDLPLPTALALVAALTLAAWYGLSRRKPTLAALPLVAATLFVLCWGLVDARWMFNFGRQVSQTAMLYAGKTPEQRHLAAEDGALYAFIERARTKLPQQPARVFMVADAHYFRGRGAYHLYPHNVFFDPWRNTIPPPESLRAGDYVIVYFRRGIQYDPAQHRLRWDDNAPIGAEALLVEPGAALFRITG